MAPIASRVRVLAIVAALFGSLMFTLPVPAQPCDDADLDGNCDDADNCPAIANADQADRDGDLTGDTCDSFDGWLYTKKLKAKIGDPRGIITVNGDFALQTGEIFTADAGFLLVVRSADVTLGSFAWLPSECVTSPSGATKCASADRLRRVILKPVKKAKSEEFGPGKPGIRYSATLKGLALPGPLTTLMSVVLTVGPSAPPTLIEGIDRIGTAFDCRVKPTGVSCTE